MGQCQINPVFLVDNGATPVPGKLAVYTKEYHKPFVLLRSHRTLKAAFRTLGSVCDQRGKLYNRANHMAFILAADGTQYSWHDAKAAINA